MLFDDYEAAQSVFPGKGQYEGIAHDEVDVESPKGPAAPCFVRGGQHENGVDEPQIYGRGLGAAVLAHGRQGVGQGTDGEAGHVNRALGRQGLPSPLVAEPQIDPSVDKQHDCIYATGRRKMFY